jgi:hypothetical protein
MRTEGNESPAFLAGKGVEGQECLVFTSQVGFSIEGQGWHTTPPPMNPGSQEKGDYFFSFRSSQDSWFIRQFITVTF